LCEIVNHENIARFPKTRVGVKMAIRVFDLLKKQGKAI